MSHAGRADVRRLPPQVPLSEVVRSHARALRAAGVAAPDNDARLLALHVLGLAPHELASACVQDVNGDDLRRLADLVADRARRQPLQHLVGEAGFRTLTVTCRPGVFVPRPETETLVGLAIDRAAWTSEPVVVEPCTGTGVVALAICAEVPGVHVAATDRSVAAVGLARENLARVSREPGLAQGATAEFLEGDLLTPVPEDLRGHVDVLVCNPPYLGQHEFEATAPEVRRHDPQDALVAGPTGHEIAQRLLDEAPAWLRPGGWLLLEVDDRRAHETGERARRAGYAEVEVVDDLTRRPRFVAAQHGWGPPR